MKQPLMLQSDCVDCPFYDGFGQCIQYGNITEEIISKCEFNNKVMKANEAPEKIYLQDSMSTDTIGDLWPEWFDAKVSDNSIEYIRTDAFIEKACEWIEEINNHHHIMRYSDSCEPPLSELTEWFRNYMKGE